MPSSSATRSIPLFGSFPGTVPGDAALAGLTATNLALDARGRWRLAAANGQHAPQGELLTRVIDLGGSARLRANWLEQWTAPQRYEKHPGNPIYGPQLSGAWDDWTNGVSIIPTNNGQTYRMYYCGKKGAGIGFAEASVSDPLTWVEHPSSPVLRPRADNWEGDMINQPRVVKVTETHWRMYYSGWGFPGPGKPKVEGTAWSMGIAESFDGGTTWKRWQDEPFMERGPKGSYDDGGVFVPMVVRVGDRWLMWYTAAKIHAAGHQNIHLCFATSADGLHWEKHAKNPVVTDDFADGATRSVTSRCYVRHDDGVFRMWYSFGKPGYRICYAESLDGVEWERSPISPVLDVSPKPAWDDDIVEYPEVQIVDGVFRLWFCGNGYGSVGFAKGVIETGVTVELRAGETPTPDGSWNAWRATARGESVGGGRYAQARARLWSSNPALSPALNAWSLEVG